ncbi:hypothetical protein ERHA54_36180 [Erwinia rhapontici]|uniref:Uncharacterized protein n=1 Tax=Erwinia rhapontici TaxID=55212 RepID=A0ABM7N3I5_ERWRD|nr:hypothetical protein [Erwinia rhapontici]MCS3608903.1 hypothetical protein [Erwinia rhapontici]TDS97319.1 hypothetical protein EDF84_108161 [Erwinia rhapontici]BCQ36037.1 hypothetical protein ERHA53_33800 [Erwinia rhapontici]BCQ41015.1 hypothetical protein ERHA54_36180 [Erwinia rhapontici]
MRQICHLPTPDLVRHCQSHFTSILFQSVGGAV